MLTKLLIPIGLVCFAAIAFTVSCSKNSNPTTPPTDTITVIRNDTTQLTDTLYGTKPDPTVNLTKGLLVYLNFTGNIADSSGNNNPTQAVGSSVLTYDEHGYAGNAFGSSGSSEVLVTNNGSIQFDTAYSLSFDFMVNYNGTMTYISLTNPVNAYAPTFNIGTTLPGIPYIDMGTTDVIVGCDSTGSVNNYNITDTTAFTPVTGSWYNCIAIYHTGSVQIYINGTLISSKTGLGTEADLCSSSQLIIGAWWNSDPQGMNGKMDNVRLYNRVLTPHEIVALASNYQVTSTGQKRLVQRRTL